MISRSIDGWEELSDEEKQLRRLVSFVVFGGEMSVSVGNNTVN